MILGAIIALDGHTGNSLWNLSTYSEVFELNCGNADLNGDGQKDCVGAGRKGTYTGFDYKRGRWIWTPQSGHESYINYEWNIYNPLGNYNWFSKSSAGIDNDQLANSHLKLANGHL